MSEQDIINAVNPANAMSLDQAALMRTEQRHANTDISAAASALGKRAAEARRERAQLQGQALKLTPEQEEEEQQEELAAETTTEETQASPESEQSESDPAGTIALPDGTKITVDEASKGYLRQSDYTRKTQEVAQMRKVMEAEYADKLAQAQNLLQQFQEPEPNWAELVNTLDPWEFNKQRVAWDTKQRTRAEAQAKLDQAKQASLTQAKAEMLGKLQQSTLEPSWATQDGLNKGLDGVTNYLRSQYGVTDQELRHTTDWRLVEMAEKARRFDELQKAKPAAQKAIVGKPKVVTPGAKNVVETAVQRGMGQLQERFRASGSMEDAMNFYKASRNIQ